MHFMISRRLEYLLALADAGHFARAAAACRVSQPTLSVGIQQLEADFGVQIIKHGRRFLGFTPEGEIVLEWARQASGDYARVRQRLLERSAYSSGDLRIGMLGSAVPLMRVLTSPFHQQYPGANLIVNILSPFEIQQGFKEDSLDIGITYLGKDFAGARTQQLYSEEYELLIRKGSRYSGQPFVPWTVLKEFPLCLMSPKLSIFGTREAEMLSEALGKTPHIITTSIWLVMDHVRSGEWASVLPRPVRMMFSADDELEAIPFPTTGAPPMVGMVLPPKRTPSPLAKTFFSIGSSPETIATLNAMLSPKRSAGTRSGGAARRRSAK